MTVLVKDSTLRITRISPHIGAEATGVDLAKPVDETTRRQLNEALVENVTLVIRGQAFTPAQYVAAGRLFGELMEQDQTDIYGHPEQPLIRQVSNMYTDKTGARLKYDASWHTDHTHFVHPPKYTMLYPVNLPTDTVGGGTSVCNTRAGYAALSDRLKQRIAGLKTVNQLAGAMRGRRNPLSVQSQMESKREPVIQPLVRTNPDHGGSKSLYFHPRKTVNIVGMDPEATQDLLDELLEHLLKPEFIYVHPWRMGDLLIWDNRASLHKAGTDFDASQLRLLYRLVVKGERPY